MPDPIMSPAQADALLASGIISPEQHAEITGPASMSPASAGPPQIYAPPTPPPAPAPPSMPNASTMPASVAASSPASAPASASELPPKDAEILAKAMDLDKGTQAQRVAGTLSPKDIAESFAAKGIPMPGSQGSIAPSSRVDVGPITQANPAGMQTPSGASPPTSIDPRVAGYKRDVGFAGEEKGVLGREAEAHIDQAKEAYAAQLKTNDDLRQQAAIDTGNRVKEQADIDNQVRSTHAAIDDYANTKVDTNHFWKSQSTGQKIAGLLAVALGGFNEGFTHGAVKNRALESIQNSIEQDIHAQEAAINAKGQAVSQKRGVLSDMIAVTGSKESARAASRVAAYQDLQKQLDMTASKFGPALQQGQADQLRLDIDKKLSGEKMQLDQMLRSEAGMRAASTRKEAERVDDKLFSRGVELSKLSQEDRKIAVDEAKANAGQVSSEDSKHAFEKQWHMSTSNIPMRGTGLLPSVKESSRTYDAANAALLQTIHSMAPKGERLTAADIEHVFSPLLPKPGDSEKVLEAKKSLIQSRMKAGRYDADALNTTAPPGEE